MSSFICITWPLLFFYSVTFSLSILLQCFLLPLCSLFCLSWLFYHTSQQPAIFCSWSSQCFSLTCSNWYEIALYVSTSTLYISPTNSQVAEHKSSTQVIQKPGSGHSISIVLFHKIQLNAILPLPL